jgi:REP element-mobilizing transposase RayT
MYHIVCPAKYKRTVITEKVDKKLKEICLEIGTEKEHVHFLVQSIPAYSPASIVQKIKSITARKIFETCPEVKKSL